MLVALLVFVLVYYGVVGTIIRLLDISLSPERVFKLEDLFALAVATGCQIAFLQIVTRSVPGHHALLGLGIGGLVGVGLSLILGEGGIRLSQILGNITLRVNSQASTYPILDTVGIVYGALVWVSVVFFPELLARRVGWGGVIVWAGLVVAIFGTVIGLSFAFAG